VAAALIALAVPNVASAQIPGAFNVDTQRDGNDGECARDCTLREAIALGSGQGTFIMVPAGVYKLTLGELVLRNNTTIVGAGLSSSSAAGARTTIIDAQGRSRVVNVPANSATIVAGVTLTGGRAADGAGALVGNNGGLQLVNAVIDGNVATGRGGGAHAPAGTIILTASTVSNNRAAAGGGIALDTQAVLSSFASTISGNTASGSGGGVTSLGSMALQNVTIADNTAASGGGVFIEPGGNSGGDSVNNTIIGVNAGGSCGGAFGTEPHFGWTGNIGSDATCNFLAGEGRNSLNPQLGALRNNRGPTDTMALQSGSPAINAGDTNRCFGRDQRGAEAVGVCDIGAFEFGGQVPETELPPPVPGETVNVTLARGTVKVKLPGSDEFFTLQDGQQLPMGSTLDTSKGRVNLIAAANNTGRTQRAWFYQGVFKVNQSKGRKPLTTLAMAGKLQCGGGKATTAAAKKRKRRLWGDGKGRFRTKGKHSAATVVGTKWLVEDRCNGTLTRVLRGKVRVRDFKRRKNILVTAGHKYFAKR
jgi:hypothetical protein